MVRTNLGTRVLLSLTASLILLGPFTAARAATGTGVLVRGFHDEDGDGSHETGEADGAFFDLWITDLATGEGGRYERGLYAECDEDPDTWCLELEPGDYRVEAIIDWTYDVHFSTVNEFTLSLSTGEVAPIDVGWYRIVTIRLHPFEDKDRDGIRDSDELDPFFDSSGPPRTPSSYAFRVSEEVVDQFVTYDSYFHTYNGLEFEVAPGSHVVDAWMQGWTPTVELPRTVTVADTSNPDGVTETIYLGFRPAVGHLALDIFEDRDADGVRAANDTTRDASVDLAQDGKIVTTVRASQLDPCGAGYRDGCRIMELPPGTYEVQLTAVADSLTEWTAGATTTVTIEDDQTTALTAGVYGFATATGRLFEDADGDGAADPDEDGVDGATVRIFDGSDVVATTETTGDGSYELQGLVPGTYTVDVLTTRRFTATTPTRREVTVGSRDRAEVLDIGLLRLPATQRVAGASRTETAAALVEQAFPGHVETVFVATARDFPDALAGGPAAATIGAPLLLTGTDTLDAFAEQQIRRMTPDRVVILGGLNAVSANVETQLGTLADRVDRIAGSGRFDTAARIVAEFFPERATTVYVATGASFPDALAGGAVAASSRSPLLLTEGGRLPEVTGQQLDRLAPTRVVVLGGTAAVSDEVVTRIRGRLPEASIERIAGPSRYETAAAVAATTDADKTLVLAATGASFPDALAGVPAAAQLNAALVLVDGTSIPPATTKLLNTWQPVTVMVLGGFGAITADIERGLGRLTLSDSARYSYGPNEVEAFLDVVADRWGQQDVEALQNLADEQAGQAMASTGLGDATAVYGNDCDLNTAGGSCEVLFMPRGQTGCCAQVWRLAYVLRDDRLVVTKAEFRGDAG